MQLEDKIKLTKFLHNKHTRKEIEEYLSVDKRTRQRYMKEIDDNNTVSFLNTEYPLYFQRKKSIVLGDSDKRSDKAIFDDAEYQSTVHPVFLPLNLTEVYALTTHLLDICGDQQKDIYRGIAEMIYSQL